jgi:hypothetical protein
MEKKVTSQRSKTIWTLIRGEGKMPLGKVSDIFVNGIKFASIILKYESYLLVAGRSLILRESFMKDFDSTRRTKFGGLGVVTGSAVVFGTEMAIAFGTAYLLRH